MKELIVISGKGGTGKTSVLASFAALAQNAVVADCDVDAADLHLLLEPEVRRREPFFGGKRAAVDPEMCAACGKCAEVCRFDAVRADGPASSALAKTYRIEHTACEGCGVCAWFCPTMAIELNPAKNGEWYLSDTRCGPMVHAQLGVAEENSGKLVTTVRTEARKAAQERGRELVLVDGSPGIGCPVIASIAGADMVLMVTEPTVSGRHDLERAAALARHFEAPSLLCINKYDLNLDMTREIEAWAQEQDIPLAGRIRYDRRITHAQIERLSVVEYAEEGAAEDIRVLWERVAASLSRDCWPAQEHLRTSASE
jgi:MinD superfamily P-loop ATPase